MFPIKVHQGREAILGRRNQVSDCPQRQSPALHERVFEHLETWPLLGSMIRGKKLSKKIHSVDIRLIKPLGSYGIRPSYANELYNNIIQESDTYRRMLILRNS